jgi:hypothetical protein
MKKSLVLLFPYIVFAKIFMISQLDFNAGSSAMRNSDIALYRQYGSIYSNPAFLESEDKSYLSSGYRKYFSDIHSGGLTVSVPALFGFSGTTAFSLSTINYGEFKDMETGSAYNPYEVMAVVSHGLRIKNVSAGANFKYFFSKISDDYTSNGISADLCAFTYLYEDRLGMAFGIYNLGYQLDPYYNSREDMALSLRTGLGYKVEKLPLTLTAAYNHCFSSSDRMSVGFELQAKENLTLRGGYDFSMNEKEIGTNSKSEKFAGLALGIGLNIKGINFDAAYMVNGELDDEMSLTLSTGLKDILK